MAALCGITAAGALASLMFAAKAAMTFMPKSDAAAPAAKPDAAQAEQAASRRNAGLAVATLAAFAPLALTKNNPAAYGDIMAIPAGLAWSVLGWLVAHDWKASGVPGSWLVNPMVAGALSANLGVYWHGVLSGVDWVSGMHSYLGQVSSRNHNTDPLILVQHTMSYSACKHCVMPHNAQVCAAWNGPAVPCSPCTSATHSRCGVLLSPTLTGLLRVCLLACRAWVRVTS